MVAPFDITGVRIETERLILRPWQEEDLQDLYAYASVPGVGEMAGWNHHKSIEESQFILNLFIRGKKTFAIELKETGHVIGSLGLEEQDADPAPEKLGREIGYVLSKEYWGVGLMPEAVSAVIDYCFDTLRYDFVTCGHFLRNDRSRRVVEKCGFRFFGESKFETRYETVEISRNYVRYNLRNHPGDCHASVRTGSQ